MGESDLGTESRFGAISAAILTGGASTRMGRDKARMDVGGSASATRLARLLGALFADLLLVGGSPPEEAPGRRVPDPDGPACALRGLVAALDAAREARVLVVATDLPLLTADLVLALVAAPEADVVVPRTGRGRHPLCALYRRESVAGPARQRLAQGELALHGLLDAVDTVELGSEELALVDPGGRALTNVNTPGELREAERLLGDARPA